VTASLDTLGQAKRRFFGPRNHVRSARGNRAQAGRAGVFLRRTGQAAHLIIAPVRATFRTRHRGRPAASSLSRRPPPPAPPPSPPAAASAAPAAS